MNGVNDDFLVDKIKNGDEEAFNCLFDKYKGSVYAICYRYTRNEDDARELVQDIFIKIYRNINTFKGEAKFFTWLYRIAVNACLSFKRKKTWIPVAETAPESKISIEERIIMKKAIDDAVANLPKRQRMVFILRHFEGHGFEEIASLMKITTGAAKSHHHHAIMKLRSLLKDWL